MIHHTIVIDHKVFQNTTKHAKTREKDKIRNPTIHLCYFNSDDEPMRVVFSSPPTPKCDVIHIRIMWPITMTLFYHIQSILILSRTFLCFYHPWYSITSYGMIRTLADSHGIDIKENVVVVVLFPKRDGML